VTKWVLLLGLLIRVFFGGAVLVAFQLDEYLVGWVIDKFPFKF